MKPRDILVVGGGLVGSLWALMLARRGHRVHVAERRADMRKMSMSAGKSINLALSDRGLRALDLAGAGDVVRKEAIPIGAGSSTTRRATPTSSPTARPGSSSTRCRAGGSTAR